VPPKCFQREVDPVAFGHVLTHVADEIRHLKRLAELRRVGERLHLGLLVELHDRRHHPADGGRGAVHVRLKLVVGLVPVGFDVARHRVDERVHVFVRDLVFVTDRGERLQHWVVGVSLSQRGPTESIELRPLFVWRRSLRSVDDLVGDTEEAVQHVRRVPDPLREQPGRDVERLPGPTLDPLSSGNLRLVYHADLW